MAAAIATLAPVPKADVLLDVSAAGIGLDMHRPSDIRMFGHAFEWAGYANYTKALPQYQLELSKPNRFTYYGTSKDGGRVYFSGFNEEGFAVSNRGIEDIQTGEIEAPEQPDAEGPACTFFGCLRVGNADDPALEVAGNTELAGTLEVAGNTELGGTLEVTGASTLTGNVTLGGTITGGHATTATDGLVEIATAAELAAAINGTDQNPTVPGATLVPNINDLDTIVDDIADQIIPDIGLLRTQDRIIYVAAAAGNVPDADLTADGALGDARLLRNVAPSWCSPTCMKPLTVTHLVTALLAVPVKASTTATQSMVSRSLSAPTPRQLSTTV